MENDLGFKKLLIIIYSNSTRQRLKKSQIDSKKCIRIYEWSLVKSNHRI